MIKTQMNEIYSRMLLFIQWDTSMIADDRLQQQQQQQQ